MPLPASRLLKAGSGRRGQTTTSTRGTMANCTSPTAERAAAHISAAILVVIAMLAPATVIAATTYEVSTTGNDTNTGKTGSPLRTIQKAANLVSPGDTVLIDPG